MAINEIGLSYPDFKLNDIIDPEQFDINNNEISEKINEVLGVLNQITDSVEQNGSGADAISLSSIAPFTSTKLQHFLSDVITRLQSTGEASGASFIGSASVDGVAGQSVQAQLKSLASLVASLKAVDVKHDEQIRQLDYNISGVLTPQTFDDLSVQNVTMNELKLGYVDDKLTPIRTQLAQTASDIDLLKRSKGTVSILDYENLKVVASPDYDWKPAIQAAIDSGAEKVTFPDGIFYSSTFEISDTLCELQGVGNAGTIIKHLGGGALLQKKSTIYRVRDFSIIGIYFEGNGSPSETYGLDLTGFSYGLLSNVRVRLFTLDGIYAQGDITPNNMQVSNLCFVKCVSNNNLRHGLNMAAVNGTGQNTANTFIGCEFDGNSQNGTNIQVGELNAFYGCTIQGNGAYDIYDNGFSNSYQDCWLENADPKTVFLDSSSKNITISKPKLSYPIWNALIDKGNDNTIIPNKQKGLIRPKVLNTNTLLENPDVNGMPSGYTKNGTPTTAQIDDNLTINKKAIRFTVTADFQGYVIPLTQHPLFLQGKWVTVKIRYKANTVAGVVHRIQTRFDTTNNGTTGELVVETFENTNGNYVTRLFDVKFPDSAGTATSASIIHYLAFSGGTGNTNTIDIAEIEVLF